MHQHRLAILALDNFVPFDLAIPQLMFPLVCLANGEHPYQLFFCGPRPVIHSGSMQLHQVAPLETMLQADTVMIPGILQAAAFHDEAVQTCLQRAFSQGVRLASICSGAAILAAAGLLEGLPATTHWELAPRLAQRYPNTQWDSEVLFVDNGQLLTSAGLSAGQDLCLHLIQRDFGALAAATVANFVVMPQQRQGGQAQQIQRLSEVHGSALAQLQLWLLDNLHQPLRTEDMARQACLSVRSLSRHFRQQASMSPMAWLTQARIRRAQSLLESSDMPVEQVAAACGFGSAAGLREAFAREVGSSPSAWRKTYRGFGGRQ